MSITKPSPERLTKGKHLIKEGIVLNYWNHLGEITKVSKSRVYYTPLRYNTRQQEWEIDGIEQYIHIDSVRAVADSADEARNFCLKWREKDDDIWGKYRVEVKTLIKQREDELNEQKTQST